MTRKPGHLYDFATNKQLFDLKVAIVKDLKVLLGRVEAIETFLTENTADVPDDMAPEAAGSGPDAAAVEPVDAPVHVLDTIDGIANDPPIFPS